MRRLVKALLLLAIIAPSCSHLVYAQAQVGGAGAYNGFRLDSGGVIIDTIRDEDTMSSDDPNALATQQSIKAYADNYSAIPFDNVVYAPESGDATAIDIESGGKFTLASGQVVTFTSTTNLDINDDLTTDDTLTADTFYYIWSNGTTTKISDDPDSAPSDVSNGVRLRGGVAVYDNSGTSEIIPFIIAGDVYWYLVDSDLATAGNVTEIYNGNLPTSFTDVDASHLMPAGDVNGYIAYRCDGAVGIYWRPDGSSLTTGLRIGTSIASGDADMFFVPFSDGIIEMRLPVQYAVKAALNGFQL